MSDTQELKELLEKVIQQTKVATEYLQKKIEEKQAEVNRRAVKTNAETIKDLQHIKNNVVQLIEENELLKQQYKPSKSRAAQDEHVGRSTFDLQAAESRNAQLSKRLAKTEAELQALKMSQLRMESVTTTKTATQNASLIEKLYSAQKDRDKAVEEERLSTTKKLNKVEKQLQKERAKQNSKVDTDIDDNAEKLLPVLLDELAEASGAEQIKQKGQTLLDHIYEWQKLQNKKSTMNRPAVQLTRETERFNQHELGTTADQIKYLQWKNLHDKFDDWQLICQKFSPLTFPLSVFPIKRNRQLSKFGESSIHQISSDFSIVKDQLKDAIDEKNVALHQLKKLESDHEDLTILYSLQRHLTQEGEIKEEYEKKIDQYKKQLENAEQKIIHVSDELSCTIKERNALIQSRNQLAEDLLIEQERNEKLDRIVMVLRRKVQATSADSTPVHI